MGTVACGKRADLLLLAANAADDVGNRQHRTGVMARGRWFWGELQRALEELAAAYRQE
jgi:hypothetical protein